MKAIFIIGGLILLQVAVHSAGVQIEQGTQSYFGSPCLPELVSGVKSGNRSEVRHIVFDTPFVGEPKIFAALSSIDNFLDRNLRIRTYAENITNTGFDLVLETWWDTKLCGGTVSWMAIL